MSYGRDGNRNNPLRMAAGDKPRREVFPSGEIAHLWAHQTQTRARNAQGNFYFKGPTIYSYRDSWPLARIYKKTGKPQGSGDAVSHAGTLVLTNSERYSVTTAQQQSGVNRAANHLPQIAVPIVDVEDQFYGERERAHRHAENLKYLIDLAADELAKAKRAQQLRNVERRCNVARRAIDDARLYMEYFGIRRKAPEFPQTEWTAAAQRAERIETPDPVRDAKKIAQRQKAIAREVAAAFIATNCARSAWRLGDSLPYVGYNRRRRMRGDLNPALPVMLRVSGEEIETSLGARVPLAAAPMVWNAVERVRKSGRQWLARREFQDASAPKIGHYPLDRIEADGTLHAGCHVIPHSELRIMARALGLVQS